MTAMKQELGLEIERIKGRYRIMTITISAVASIITAIIATTMGGKYYPIEKNVNYNNYINTVQQEAISQIETDDQQIIDRLYEEAAALREENTELKEDNRAKQAQIKASEQENKELNAKIIWLESQLDSIPVDPSPVDPNDSNPKETVKLTSLKVLGNTNDYWNHVNNSLENGDDAKSNLGETFNSSISMSYNGNIDFYLERNYKTLSSVICISESTKDVSGYSSTLTICKVEGNGPNETVEALYTSPALTMGFIPTSIPPIDVSEVEHLRISFYTANNGQHVPRIILGNPELVPK